MRPFWQGFFGGILGRTLVGVFLAICTAFGVGPDKWIANMIQNFPYMTVFVMRTIFVLLGLFTFAFILASFKNARKLRSKIDENIETSPLEIIFDPTNPSGRFWSMEPLILMDKEELAKTGGFWQYRVEIKNNSMRTVRNVSVTTEHMGPMRKRPEDQPFDKIKKTSCDIKPGCSELVFVKRWPLKIQPGMLMGSDALAYGPIKITASGDDVLPVTRIFQFDYQRTPMIFDQEKREGSNWSLRNLGCQGPNIHSFPVDSAERV